MIGLETVDHSKQSVLNLKDALDRVGGDRELLHELAQLFLSEMPLLLREIEAAIRAQDSSRLEHNAHSLKGAIANFGAEKAAQCAYVLERMGREKTWHSVDQAWVDLERELGQAGKALKAL